MKAFKITLAAMLLIFAVNCKKTNSNSVTDKTNPTINLNGNSKMEISYGTNTADPGATAADDTDGDISANIESDWNSKVNVNALGVYNVVYQVKDKSGNQVSVVREVSVKLKATSFYGDYNSSINGNSFNSSITAGNNSNQFILNPFLLANNLVVNITGSLGTELTYSQSGGGYTLNGTGTVQNLGQNLILTYTVYKSDGSIENTYTETLSRK